jgi:hypothetical protein
MQTSANHVETRARAAARLGPADALVVCFERLDAPHDRDDLVRCVALPGNAPGLSLGPKGTLHWQRSTPEHCLVMVSTDRQLVLWRPMGSVPVRLCREGRSLDLPEERVVIAIDEDEIEVGTARLRVHLHGSARRIHPPFRVRLARAVSAATLAGSIGAGASAMMSTGCDRSAESGVASSSPNPSASASTSAVDGADAAVDGGVGAGGAGTDGGAATASDGGIVASAASDSSPATVATSSASAPSPSASAPRPTPTKPPIKVRKRPPVYMD